MYRKSDRKLSIFVPVLVALGVALSGCSALGAVADAAQAVDVPATADVAEAAMEETATVPVSYQDNAQVAGLEDSLASLYEAANPSVVYVIVPPIGTGSGFVYSEDGYIVTNNHVVEGGQSYEIVFATGERMYAELVGADVDSDLAVLKVDALPDGVEPLPLAEVNSVSVGQFAVAIGSPFGEQGSMSLGIISGLGRSLSSQRTLGAGSSYSLPGVIQTDAPINPGNSGGPLLNLNGEVLGLTSAIATSSGTNSGVGFAIPVDAIRRIVPGLISDGSYAYPYVGAAFDGEITLDDLDVYGLTDTRGAYIVSVTPGSPAANAGLVAADQNTGAGGDLITAIDGQVVNSFDDLNSYLVFNASVGQTVDLTVLRNGEEITVPLTLQARP